MKKNITIILLIILISLIIRTGLANYRHVIGGDEVGYVLMGKNMAMGYGYYLREGDSFFAERFLSHYPHSPAMQTPFYPLFAAFIYIISKSLTLASKLNYILFGGLVAVPVYFLAKRIYGERTALISTCLMAFMPSWLCSYHLWNAVTEQSYVLIISLGALFLYVGLIDKKRNLILLASLFFGLSYLSRPEGPIYFIFGAILVFLYYRKIFILYLAPFVSVYAVYVSFNYLQIGSLYLTAPKIHWVREAGGGKILTNFIESLRSFGSFGFFPFYLFVFISLGLFKERWNEKRTKNELFLFLFVIAQLIAVTPLIVRTRYFFASLPFILIWVGHGIEEVEKWFISQKYNSLKFLPFTLILLSFLIMTPAKLALDLKNAVEHKKLGLWIKENTPGESVIMTREFQTLFYSERKGVDIPKNGDLKGSEKTADYLIIDEIVWNNAGPFPYEMRKYLEAKDYGFMYPVYEGPKNERKVVLYKFRK